MIKIVESYISNLLNIKIKVIKKEHLHIYKKNFKHTVALKNDYLLLYNDENIKTVYLIKRFFDEFLIKLKEYQSIKTQFRIFKRELLEIIEYNKAIKGHYNKKMLFSFFKKDSILYVICEDDKVIHNSGVDKFTINIYKQKLEAHDEISIPYKSGEIFAIKNEHFKAILISEKKLSSFIKNIVKGRLILLNYIYKVEDNFYRDKITSLYNREKFLLELKNKEYRSYAIFFINIVDFKKINQIYGSNIGDKVLIEFSKRLKKISQEVFRIYSDRFAILIPVKSYKIYLKKLENIEKKFSIDENIKIEIDIKIIYFKNRVENIIERANIAFKKSKKNIILFDDIKKILDKDKEYFDILEKAIQQNLIVPFFQKVIYNSVDQKIAYYETLMRISDGKRVLLPIKFIEIAKEHGIYNKLNFIMLNKSIKSIKYLNSKISINLDTYDILQTDFFDKFKHILVKNRVDGSFVQIELLENEDIYKNFDEVRNFFSKIKKLNCSIALDDFGKGYSNFSLIKDIKIDTIKLDISLVKDILKDEKNFFIVDTLTKLINQLDIKIAAEGIENKKIYEKLKDLPIDYLQGYYFAKPLPLEKIAN